ncbi:hypothetical protein QR680_010020 [Steinernema hermaphroditum]|uniref:Integrase zinc-binding domain-containing protein n=1 Tax=Steinernema hermaphroditum TaxID=289476 RepID=A0AA39IPC2_9BILA|nr:hypothetical protein QR680_010020 [Steinernema hermaphroditum]
MLLWLRLGWDYNRECPFPKLLIQRKTTTTATQDIYCYGGMTDADYNDVSSLLNDGVNPREGKVARQSLKRKATDYIIINEKLCKKEGDATLIVVKKGEELRHIERVHLETGHGGRDVCLEKLKKGYYWNRMKHDIVHFIAHCHQCQLNRTALSTQNNELRPVRPPRQPCTMVQPADSSMRNDLMIIGTIYVVSPLLLVPFQIRIIYIFLAQNEFKALQCFKIMAMISMANISYGLCFVPMGITILTQNGLNGFTLGAFKLWMASWAAILALDLALAVNRLRLICNFHFLWTIGKYLHFAALIYPLTVFLTLLTPLAGIVFLDDKVFFTYDFHKPLSDVVRRVHGIHNLFCVTATLLVYISISVYLITQKCKHKAIGMSSSERTVVIQAAVKFSANMFVLVTMNFFGQFFQQSVWAMTAIPLFQIVNLLCLPLIVYIGFNRSLQKIFFRKKLNTFVLTTVVTPIRA